MRSVILGKSEQFRFWPVQWWRVIMVDLLVFPPDILHKFQCVHWLCMHDIGFSPQSTSGCSAVWFPPPRNTLWNCPIPSSPTHFSFPLSLKELWRDRNKKFCSRCACVKLTHCLLSLAFFKWGKWLLRFYFTAWFQFIHPVFFTTVYSSMQVTSFEFPFSWYGWLLLLMSFLLCIILGCVVLNMWNLLCFVLIYVYF